MLIGYMRVSTGEQNLDLQRDSLERAGDVASFNLVDASCSAEAVARLPDRVAVFHRGTLAAGALGAGV